MVDVVDVSDATNMVELDVLTFMEPEPSLIENVPE
jgi:hypothetical protein